MEMQMEFTRGVCLAKALKRLALAITLIVGAGSIPAWAQDVARGAPPPPDEEILKSAIEAENAEVNKNILNDQTAIGTAMPAASTVQGTAPASAPQAMQIGPGIYGVPGDPKVEAQFNRALEESNREELTNLAADLPQEGPGVTPPQESSGPEPSRQQTGRGN